MSFSKDIRRFSRGTELKAVIILRRAGAKSYEDLLEFSPVATGLYIKNHRVGINAPNRTVALRRDRKYRSRRGGAINFSLRERLLTRAARTLSRVVLGDSIHLTNNAPHAQRIEDGWSKQAPRGVYSLAGKKMGTNVPAIVRSTR